MRNASRLLDLLEKRYRGLTPRSAALHGRAENVMVRGGSHTLRLWYPYPFFASRAAGARIWDVDGNSYIDYWQGHYANILGHNPPEIREGVRSTQIRATLHTGFEGTAQIELAEILLRQLGHKDWKVRFTTSGTLAGMYSAMLARAHTGREYILKIGGGWHGASPYLLKGVKYHPGSGFENVDSAGVDASFRKKTLVTRFNDEDDLAHVFGKMGGKIAGFVVEPFQGVGGFLAASQGYLDLARKLTSEYGALLVFDEVISGFRFCPSGVQKLYGIEPDISIFGKMIGGGHAVAAVAGKRSVMEGCEKKTAEGQRVLFDGGTFSAHPGYMAAGAAMLRHLAEHAGEIYPRIGKAGDELRRGIEEAFRGEGIEVRCTGWGNDVVRESSMYMVNFPLRKTEYKNPEDSMNERISDLKLREVVLKLALLVEGTHVVHGGGAVSLAHHPTHIRKSLAAYGEAAALFRKYLYS